MHSYASCRTRPALLLALLLGLVGGPARADVVRPEPEDCPVGSVGDTSHCGPICRMLECTGDGECNGGDTCQPTKACLHVGNCLMPPPKVHGGACSPEGTCGGKDTCE